MLEKTFFFAAIVGFGIAALATWSQHPVLHALGLQTFLRDFSEIYSRPADTKTHKYQVHILSRDPYVVYITNFLSQAEISHVLSLGDPLFAPSLVKTGSEDVATRSSMSAFLPTNDTIISRIQTRAASFLGSSPYSDIAPLQLVRYGPTQHFTYHTDWSPEPRRSKSGSFYQVYSSFFVFVQADCEGGETHFPYLETQGWGVQGGLVSKTEAAKGLGTAFQPTVGNAVFWFNLHANGTGDERTLHAGLPVKEGIKTGMNIWSRVLWNEEN